MLPSTSFVLVFAPCSVPLEARDMQAHNIAIGGDFHITARGKGVGSCSEKQEVN